MENRPSFTYHLTHIVLRLKGYKKIFSQSPLPFHLLRKEDVTSPIGKKFKQFISSKFQCGKSEITVIETSSFSKHLIIYLHGGAFVSGPGKHHWDSIMDISISTKMNVWMVNYPKAPESEWSEIQANIDLVYEKALQSFHHQRIIIMGDSAGGTLALNLVQRLLKKQYTDIPGNIFLISPVVDLSMTNPAIDTLETKDKMLSKNGVLSAKQMLNAPHELNAPEISPLFEEIEKLPKSYWYLAEHDITYPDQLKMIERLEESGRPFHKYIGYKLPHIWPLMPVMKEARQALDDIKKHLNNIKN